MADGSTKPLDQVKVGDKVEATDPATGKTSAQTVTKVWVDHDTDLMDITIRAGGKTSVIHATQHHPFWDATRHAWTKANNLPSGDRLRTDDGANATVVSTTVVSGAADMWDLTVQTTHDLYVVTSVASVLVHNCPTDAGGGQPSLSELPRGARTTTNEQEVFSRLAKNNGIDANTASARCMRSRPLEVWGVPITSCLI